MQVAKKALRKEPSLILWSVNAVEHLLQSIQQLTDPPLDLNTVMQRASLLRSSPACCVRMASWLRDQPAALREGAQAVSEQKPWSPS